VPSPLDFSQGGWFNESADAGTPPPPPPKPSEKGKGTSGDDYALGKVDRSGGSGMGGSAVSAVAKSSANVATAASGGKSASKSGDADVGGWGVVDASEKVVAAVSSEPKVDAIKGVDGHEAAVTFAAKATPSLKVHQPVLHPTFRCIRGVYVGQRTF
jgi:hypothetical protein